jgi:hypothetical protein
MIPSGWYATTLSVLILTGAFLALTGRDRRLIWPAGALLLSLVSARSATALEAYTLPILLVATPVCAILAIIGRSRVSYVIAAVYLPRLACYGAFAFGLIPLWFMWEASNAFLIIQIIALFTGALGGGHMVRDLVVGNRNGSRVGHPVHGAAAFRDRAEPDS